MRALVHGRHAVTLELRAAQERELEHIALLHNTTVAEIALQARGMGFGAPDVPTLEESAGLFSERLADEDALLLVALEGGELLGYVSAVIETCGDDLLPAPFLTIEYAVTAPQARGRGVAGQLIAEAERIALKRGITHADLLVWSCNDGARRLYEKLGYRAIEQRMAKRLK